MSDLKIRLLTISDGRDKTGIVTFIKIFQSFQLDDLLRGYCLTIACYKDLPSIDVAAPEAAPPVPQVPQPVAAAELKVRVKDALLGNALGALFLFIAIFCRRGLIATWKAKRAGTADLYFYQDFVTAILGRFLFGLHAKHILVLHSGADPLKQLFIVFHGMRGTWLERTIRQSFGWILRKQDMVITLSEALAAQVRESYGVVEVRCIYNTAKFLSYCPSNGRAANAPVRLVAVGSLQYVKGFDILLQAIGRLCASKRDRITLDIVGEGDERQKLQELIELHDLGGTVRLVGNSNAVADFLRHADMFVLSSRDEGLPMAVLEAMQCGLPILSTRVGTVPEILDATSCVFVDTSIDGLGQAISDTLDGRYDLAAMGQASLRTFQENLSQKIFLDKYLAAFNAVCRKGDGV